MEYIKEVQAVKGYLNFTFIDEFWTKFLAGVITDGRNYGQGEAQGKALVEFVSANPTGPLHIGHARGAIIGMALSNLMEKAGFKVVREYYINDYGVQIKTLLRSIQFRYEQALGLHEGESVPEGCYPGEYLLPFAQSLADNHGTKCLGLSEDEFYALFKQEAVDEMMATIKADLKALGLEYDSFVSETKIVEDNEVDKALELLATKTKVVSDDDGEHEVPLLYTKLKKTPRACSGVKVVSS